MATTITSECINCGACEPECPNTAIYAGGVPWEFNGASSEAIAQEIFYIVPQKCTECVGFHDHEACAAVCPVDCCVPDPNNLEAEGVLLQRARELHPELTIADDAPSRFRKDGAAAPAPGGDGAAAAATNGAAAKPAAAPAPAAAKPAAPAMVVNAAPAALAAPVAMVNLPKDIGALPGPIGEKHFSGELNEDFETVLGKVDSTSISTTPAPVKLALRLGEPIFGAMPDQVKHDLEKAAGLSAFSRIRSTALNLIVNLIVYPAVLLIFAVAILGDPLFSQATGGWILLGLLISVGEGAWRLREGVIQAKPSDQMVYRGCWYGLALAPVGSMLVKMGGGKTHVSRKVAFEGYSIDIHDEKTERDRRYGTVYTVDEFANAYLVWLEMPRKIPASSLKRLWNLPNEMPDYEYNMSLADGLLTVSASVRGDALRRLSYVSASFPADFVTRITFGKPVNTFKHRLRNKVLEIIVMKGEPGELKHAA
jgi:ferredoxin